MKFLNAFILRLRKFWTKLMGRKWTETFEVPAPPPVSRRPKQKRNYPASWRNVVRPVRPFAPPKDRTRKAIIDMTRPGWARKRDRRRVA